MRHNVDEWKSLAAPNGLSDRQLNDWQAQVIIDAIADICEMEDAARAERERIAQELDAKLSEEAFECGDHVHLTLRSALRIATEVCGAPAPDGLLATARRALEKIADDCRETAKCPGISAGERRAWEAVERDAQRAVAALARGEGK